MIAIIDVCGNNLTSLANALQRLGMSCVMTSDADEIKKASHVILPGVGAAKPAMQALKETGLDQVIKQITQPLLGICLGMQLLYEHSEEGQTECLGLLPGTVTRLPDMTGFPVPHMGWNRLHWCKASRLQQGIGERDYVYFVHSYAAAVDQHTQASGQYSSEFAAIVERDRICGMQFHPEKSGDTGLKLLANFLSGLTEPRL